MFWVILGHAYFLIMEVPIANISEVSGLLDGWLFPLVPGGFFAVDIFFYLSAFLGAYLMVGKMKGRTMGVRTFFSIYLHRYLRLLPTIIGILIFVMGIYMFLGSGPIW